MIRFANLVSRDCYHRINEINNETFPVFLAGFQSGVDLCLCCNLWLSLWSTPGEFKEWFSCFQHLPSAFRFAFFFFFFKLDFSYHFVLQTQRFPRMISDKETQQGNNLQWRKSESYLEKQSIWHWVREGVREDFAYKRTQKHSQFYLNVYIRCSLKLRAFPDPEANQDATQCGLPSRQTKHMLRTLAIQGQLIFLFLKKKKTYRFFISQKRYQYRHGEIKTLLGFFTFIFWFSKILIWVPIRWKRDGAIYSLYRTSREFHVPPGNMWDFFLDPFQLQGDVAVTGKPDTLGDLSEENIILTLEMDFQFSPSASSPSTWAGTHTDASSLFFGNHSGAKDQGPNG